MKNNDLSIMIGDVKLNIRVGVILEYNKKILIEKNKEFDYCVLPGGRIHTLESTEEALIREVKEELGIEIKENEIRYLVGSTSSNIKGNIVNNHFNECYIITKQVKIEDINLQKEEVEEIRWFTKQEILERINNNFDGITDKTGCWNFLKKYYEIKAFKNEK